MTNLPRAYYNEFDPYAAQWLRNLIRDGHIAPGDVDERSIVDVRPADLAGYTQCHFFAGIGGWSLAARLAGWPDGRPLWTGSCPCQPFSEIGARKGFADSRHLWPVFFSLIRERKPPVVAGEQIANADGLMWLDAVQTDMEAANYAFAAFDISAAGIGSPQTRQRLFFISDTKSRKTWCAQPRNGDSEACSRQPNNVSPARGSIGGYGEHDWHSEPGVCRVVDGISPFVARISAFGNAIVPQVAAEIIGAYLDAEADRFRLTELSLSSPDQGVFGRQKPSSRTMRWSGGWSGRTTST